MRHPRYSLDKQPANDEGGVSQVDIVVKAEDIANREYLQLTREEAFFLVFAIGCLTVVDSDQEVIPTDELLMHFRSCSYPSPRPLDQLSPK